MINRHKIVCIVPAGRRRYLKMLFSNLVKQNFIDEIIVFENCRSLKDKDFIYKFIGNLTKVDKRWRIVPGGDGTTKSINKIYKYMREPDTFFIKLDDDIVFMAESFVQTFYEDALNKKGEYVFFSPTVFNNALCSFFSYIGR